MAGELPPEDPIRLTLTCVTHRWTHRWTKLTQPATADESVAAARLSAEETTAIGEAFAGQLAAQAVPVEHLRSVLEVFAPGVRRACRERTIALAPRLLRDGADRPEELLETARRMREVGGESDAVSQAAKLLEIGTAYLRSGRDESKISWAWRATPALPGSSRFESEVKGAPPRMGQASGP